MDSELRKSQEKLGPAEIAAIEKASDIPIGTEREADLWVEGPESSVPQLAPILALHWHKDGYVTFSVKSGDDFRPQIAIRRDELENCFPQFVNGLLKESYVSINASFGLAKYGRNGSIPTSAFGRPKHSSNNLKYLCACYADIDQYRMNADFGTVLGQVVRYQDAGAIPPASIIVRGRGMWLLWLLRDPKQAEMVPAAWPEKLELYAGIQRAITERLSTLGADLQARDAARHIRIPGSLHTGAERYVQWWIQGAAGNGLTYTLPELAQFFGVQVRGLNPRVQRVFDETQKERNRSKSKGWKALNARRLRDFVMLKCLRGGGFEQGYRNRAAMIYAWLLRCNGWNREDATREVGRMALDCHPRLTPSECRDAVRTGYGRTIRKIRDQSIGDWLDVTPAESDSLKRTPAASRFNQPKGLDPRQPRARGAAAQERQGAILQIVKEHGGRVQPCRKMVGHLEQRGINAGHVTISQDYRVLGLKTERIHEREAKAAAMQRQTHFHSMI